MKTLSRDECRAELVRRLRTVRPDSPRRWGRMSAHQMICHLGDACRMATGTVRVTTVARPLQRTMIKWIALYTPLRWPPGIPTVPEIDQTVAGTSPGDFARDVDEVIALVEAIVTRDPRQWPAHPIFGRMSPRAWMRWGYLHIDHHLRQFGA